MGKNIEKNKLNIGILIGEYGAYIALVLLRHCDQLCQSGISDRQQLLESAQTGILQWTDRLWYDMCNLIGWY